MKPVLKATLAAAVLGVLALVFTLYGRVDFMMTLAKQVWSCF